MAEYVCKQVVFQPDVQARESGDGWAGLPKIRPCEKYRKPTGGLASNCSGPNRPNCQAQANFSGMPIQ